MRIDEYARHDGLALAELVKDGEVTPSELATVAADAIAAINPAINAVIELYHDRVDSLDETALGNGPFRAVPFLIKDVGGHEKGRKIEFGSRLCAGLVAEVDTYYAKLLRTAGLNIIGRTNTPEFSMASSSENLLYGATHTPWMAGRSAGGSTGGGAAAVSAGLVPLAHGSDIAGSIRIPAAWCGGIGLKPSRGRISAGPRLSEGGHGLSMTFAQTRTMRDTAALLDCLAVPQPGDPFVPAKPPGPYRQWLERRLEPLRIAFSVKPFFDTPLDPEIAAAVRRTAKVLEDMGHHVEQADIPFDQEQASQEMVWIWFFGFDRWLDMLGAKTGRTPGPDTLEPITWETYKLARSMDPYRFLDGLDWLNARRRELGAFFTRHDVLVTPTCAETAPPLGPYGMNIKDMSLMEWMVHSERPVQYCFMYNVAGAPALSLPLAQHSNGLPIGVQLGARPSEDHILLALGAALEQAMPWRDRLPPIHASRVSGPADNS
jgi:amidase